jgi:hypothetical protein
LWQMCLWMTRNFFRRFFPGNRRIHRLLRHLALRPTVSHTHPFHTSFPPLSLLSSLPCPRRVR